MHPQPTGFEYRLQPIVSLDDLRTYSVEILLGRERCPEISTAEWIAWYEWLPCVVMSHPGKTMFVNVDGPHLEAPMVMGALQTMRRRIEEQQHGGRVVLEWTEKGAMEDAIDTILELQGQGFQIAVDDVGSGADGIGRICLVRPSYAKISHTLFHGLRSLSDIERLTRLRLSLESFGCRVILEGVETQEDLHLARSAGMSLVQGFLFPSSLHRVGDPLSSGPSQNSERNFQVAHA